VIEEAYVCFRCGFAIIEERPFACLPGTNVSGMGSYLGMSQVQSNLDSLLPN